VQGSGWKVPDPSRAVILTGAGTSAYAASAIAASWPNAQAIPTTDLLTATAEEIETHSPGFYKSGLLISLARSGDSPESVAVVKRIQRHYPAVEHLAITCNGEGQLANTPGVQSILLDPRTNDRSLAMTSSFSNLVLAGLCLRHAEAIGAHLAQICARAQRSLPELEAKAKQLATNAPQRVVVLGSGALQALATEASLKVTEMTAGSTVTLAETFLGVRHGPMSFLRPEALVLCFLSSSGARRLYEEDLVQELCQKQLGRIVGITPERMPASAFDEQIQAMAGMLPDQLRVPFEIPFAQLLAYHLSLRAGLDPDNPSPTGAITRVVQKFVIHEE
jgi:tagatose-6-phosphate ketose/aldose isomerase